MSFSREWYTTYCQNAAANVLDKEGNIRFTYAQLRAALTGAANHCVSEIPNDILNLDDNIQKLCDARHGTQKMGNNEGYALLLTLANIHAAYLMISGLWREEPIKSEGGVDEYGFEIF